jgi:hypothetical protein
VLTFTGLEGEFNLKAFVRKKTEKTEKSEKSEKRSENCCELEIGQCECMRTL